MWWEYLIIFAGLALAAGYVLWTFMRSFSAKGNCCGSSCACPPRAADDESAPRIRVTPLVELKAPPNGEK